MKVRDTPSSTSSVPAPRPLKWPRALSRIETAAQHLERNKLLVPSASNPHVSFLVCPHAARHVLQNPPLVETTSESSSTTTNTKQHWAWHKPPTSNPLLKHALTNSNGSVWKRQRPIITQAFSPASYQPPSRNPAIPTALHVALSRIFGSTPPLSKNTLDVQEYMTQVWNFVTCRPFSSERWMDGRELALEVATKAMVVAVFGERGLEEVELYKDDEGGGRRRRSRRRPSLDSDHLAEGDEEKEEEEECVKLPELMQDLFRDTLQLRHQSTASLEHEDKDKDNTDGKISLQRTWKTFHQAVECMIDDMDLELNGKVETGIFDEGLQDCLVVQLLRYQTEQEQDGDGGEKHGDTQELNRFPSQESPNNAAVLDQPPISDQATLLEIHKNDEGTVATSLSDDLEDAVVLNSHQLSETHSRGQIVVPSPATPPPPVAIPKKPIFRPTSHAQTKQRVRRATQKKFLNREEIIGNAHSALFAGTQTIATTLTGALLHLAERPELQDLLQYSLERNREDLDGEEESSCSEDDDNCDPNSMKKQLTGKDLVLETLRILPPVAGLPRVPVPVDPKSGDSIPLEQRRKLNDDPVDTSKKFDPISISCPAHSIEETLSVGHTMIFDTLAFAHAQSLCSKKVDSGNESTSEERRSSLTFDPFHKGKSYSQPWGIGSRKCPAGQLSVECISQVLEGLVSQRIRWGFAVPERDNVGDIGVGGWMEDVAYQPTLSYLRPIPLIFERLPAPQKSQDF